MSPKSSSTYRRLHTVGRRQRNLRNWRYNPSKPGEFPHLDSGDLRRSIFFQINRSLQTVRVGSNLKYAKYLEEGTKRMAQRPFLERTLIQEQKALQKLVESGKTI